MTARLIPLHHLNTHGEAELDTPTLLNVRVAALEELGRNVAVLSVLQKTHGHEAEAFERYIAVTAADDAANVEALNRIRAELHKRGVEIS